nr:hypothetical protein [Tanacetum cinerariifolium]
MDLIISLGQKNTLAEYMILFGPDNRPPMLDKDLYDSWKSRMELYMQNREHRRMILESVEHGPPIWPTVEENGVIRTKKYAELSTANKIQADCDMKATNIILQCLLANIYSLVNHHRVAKDLWERVQLLMQGTSLTKQKRECKLYDAFDKFTHIKRESLHTYYLRFTELIKDMNIYNMNMEQFQVNTKFLNNLPPEWSKFVTDVKLVKICIPQTMTSFMRILNNTNSMQMKYVLCVSAIKIHLHSFQISNTTTLQNLSVFLQQSSTSTTVFTITTRINSTTSTLVISLSITNSIQSFIHSTITFISVSHESSNFNCSINSGFGVPVFSPRDDLIAYLNKAMAFPIDVASSRFPSTNNQLRTSSNIRNQANIQDDRVTVQQVQGRQGNDAWYKEKAMLAEAHEAGQILDEEQLTFLADLGIPTGQLQTIIPHNASFQTEDLNTYDSDCDDLSNAHAVLIANISHYGSDVISEVPNSDNYLNDMDNQSLSTSSSHPQPTIRNRMPLSDITNCRVLQMQQQNTNIVTTPLPFGLNRYLTLGNSIVSQRPVVSNTTTNVNRAQRLPNSMKSVATRASQSYVLCNTINHDNSSTLGRNSSPTSCNQVTPVDQACKRRSPLSDVSNVTLKTPVVRHDKQGPKKTASVVVTPTIRPFSTQTSTYEVGESSRRTKRSNTPELQNRTPIRFNLDDDGMKFYDKYYGISKEYYDHGDPTFECKECHALLWEAKAKIGNPNPVNKAYSIRCKKGKVMLQKPPATPKPDRTNQENLFTRGGCLFQQLLMDGYTKVETERLYFHREKQLKLRCDTYSNIRSSIAAGNTDLAVLGKPVMLSSSFTGGPRYMKQNYMDAMALCRWYDCLYLFITITCNLNWPEIARYMREHNLTSTNRPDVLLRVFKMKHDQLMKDVKELRLFGRVHAAEIPDPNDDPDLYKLVLDFMMHGPCGEEDPSQACEQQVLYEENSDLETVVHKPSVGHSMFEGWMKMNELYPAARELTYAVSYKDKEVYILYGYGGTGKTFLWKTLATSIRRKGGIVLNVASSGIASLLMSGGRTAHSRFHISINIDETSTCSICPQSDLGALLKKCKLIIWDEAPMTNKLCFEALDQTLRDVLRRTRYDTCETPFENMTMVFGGDFRQVLPVIPKGSRQDIVNASLKQSYLWDHCKVLKLTANMRLTIGASPEDVCEIQDFAEWILKVGDGELGEANDGEVSIDVPEELLIDAVDDPITSIIDFTHPNRIDKTERGSAIDEAVFSPKFINGLKFSGVPNHKVALKVGVPIMLLQNIDQANGLCNGARLQVLGLTSIENDDYDSEEDMLILEELLSNNSLSLPENKSFHFDTSSSSRPLAKPPDNDSEF